MYYNSIIKVLKNKYKLSKLIGISAQFWLNLQNGYDTYQLYLKEQEQLEEEISYFKSIFIKTTRTTRYSMFL